MNFPKEIKPNPLVTSVVEIRFESLISKEHLFLKMYQTFGQTLPNVKDGPYPADLKNSEEAFKYSPDYILSNNDFSLSFSNRAIAFENVGRYKLWSNYFAFIKTQLSKFMTLEVANNVHRVGLRYASLFNVDVDVCVKAYPSLGEMDGFDLDKPRAFSAIYKKDNAKLLLQIFPQASVQTASEFKTGVLIDIDAYTESVYNRLDDSIFSIIDGLHHYEKELLFKHLLRKEFLESLDITY